MRRGAKLGWGLIALSLVVSVIIFTGNVLAAYDPDTDWDENTMTVDVNGVIYSTDGTELIYVPESVSDPVTIPASVTTVRDGAFSNSNVDQINIGENSNISSFGDQGEYLTTGRVTITCDDPAVYQMLSTHGNNASQTGGFTLDGSGSGSSGSNSGGGNAGDGGNAGGNAGVQSYTVHVKDTYLNADGSYNSENDRSYTEYDGSPYEVGPQVPSGYTLVASSGALSGTINGSDVWVDFTYQLGANVTPTPVDPTPVTPTPTNPSANNGGTTGASGNQDIQGSGGSDACNHVFTDWKAFQPATATTGERQERYCTICGYRQTRTVTRYKVDKNGTVTGSGNYSTPKTADGFDTRYLLSLSIFLGGVGAILYGRQRKFTILSERLSNR